MGGRGFGFCVIRLVSGLNSIAMLVRNDILKSDCFYQLYLPLGRFPMPQKLDDQSDRTENLSQREARQRELEKERAEEEAFAALARSPWGQAILRQHR